MDQVRGKVAVVTGAASGIGLAMTEAFVGAGMKVVMADIEEGALVAEASRLGDAGADVLAVVTDVTDDGSVAALATEALGAYGGVQVLCNNAGVAPAGPMLGTTPADWRWSVGVNVLGVAYGVSTFGPIMLEAGEGHIVNTASEAGLVTNNMLGMYCATKHAVVGLSESLYRELEDTPVGVSVLCPSLVDTKIFHSERNRLDGADMSAAEHATLGPLRESIAAMGIAPSKVAGDVLDAILSDRFWIFTHPDTATYAGARFGDIAAGRNPTSAYGQVAP